jgi:arabinofuranosyltransferase
MKLRALALLAMLHLLVAALFLQPCGPGFPLDDAWGHLVYGRSLASLEGLAYNPGQPEAGVTSPLWTYLCALPAGLVEWGVVERPDGAVRALGLLFGLLTTVVGARLAARAGRWPALATALLLTLDPLMLAGRFSGMELPLFALLTLLFVEAQLDDRPPMLGWVCGLAILTRPEGLLLALLAAPQQLASRARLRAFVPPLLVCVLPFIAWNLWAAGQPWPNTWSNKVEVVSDPRELLAALGALGGDTGLGWALPLLLAAGAVSLEGGEHRLARVLIVPGLLLLGGVLLTRPLPLGDFDPPRVPFYFERYALPAWPLLLVVAAAGLSSLVRTAWAGLFCRPRAALVLVAPLALVAGLAHAAPRHAAEVTLRFARECADVEALQVAAGIWIDAHLSRSAVVATHDAGAVRYFGKRHVLDTYGNNDARLADLLRAGERAIKRRDEAAAAHANAAILEYFRSRDPDALACLPMRYARDHSPELADLLPRLPPEQAGALLSMSEDYAALLGLTRRAVTFHVDRSAVMGSPLHQDFAVFVRP